MEREIIAKGFIANDKNCLGCIKHKKDIFISFTHNSEEFKYTDVFLTNEMAKELRDKLTKLIEYNERSN